MLPVRPRKIAFVHDWLTGMRGGERVLEILLRLHPEADLFTLFHLPGSVSPAIEERIKGVSFLQRLPFLGTSYRYYLPLFPLAVEQLPVQDYDLVIAISHCAALGALSGDQATHLCYCLTPMRYLHGNYETHFGPESHGRIKRAIIKSFFHLLRIWEVTAATRPDRIVGISNYVKRRIERRFRREAGVLYPPVAPLFLDAGIGTDREDFYLMVSAMVPYKRVEVALEAFRRNGRRLLIIGDGPQWNTLRKNATNNVRFVGSLRDREVIDHYQRCKAFVFPGEEDFGLTPIEAQACGAPVIALRRGGACEVVHPELGTFFDEPTPEALCEAVERFEATLAPQQADWAGPAEQLHAFARGFGVERFEQQWREMLEQILRENAPG